MRLLLCIFWNFEWDWRAWRVQISCAVISNSLMEYISSNFPAIFHSVYKTKEVRRTFLVAEMLDSRFPPKSHRKHTAVKKNFWQNASQCGMHPRRHGCSLDLCHQRTLSLYFIRLKHCQLVPAVYLQGRHVIGDIKGLWFEYRSKYRLSPQPCREVWGN